MYKSDRILGSDIVANLRSKVLIDDSFDFKWVRTRIRVALR